MLTLCSSDAGRTDFFQSKQQGSNQVWERKWHQREVIKSTPDEGEQDAFE